MTNNLDNYRDIVTINCVEHIYPDGTRVEYCGADMKIRAGERVAILGPNGSGKTTLLNHLTGLLKPTRGTVRVLDVDPHRNFAAIRQKIGVVFQKVEEQIIGPTVWDDIAFTPLNQGWAKDKIKTEVEYMLEEMSITHLSNKVPHYLSGGEKRKVALAGAMILKPELLILDEPFTGLDPQGKAELVQLLTKLNRKFGTALVITTHDLDLVPAIAERVYVFNRGQILANGSPGEVLTNMDILAQARLRPPAMVELFVKLRQRGYNMQIPLTVADAEAEILRFFTTGTEKCVVGG